MSSTSGYGLMQLPKEGKFLLYKFLCQFLHTADLKHLQQSNVYGSPVMTARTQSLCSKWMSTSLKAIHSNLVRTSSLWSVGQVKLKACCAYSSTWTADQNNNIQNIFYYVLRSAISFAICSASLSDPLLCEEKRWNPGHFSLSVCCYCLRKRKSEIKSINSTLGVYSYCPW